MIVPQYWAEASLKKRINGRQVTIKRFGWSDVSETEAQNHADNRAAEAMALIASGKEKINRREPKIAYNGAEGVPIREEIVAQLEDCIITRNSYGALCLNTPDVLFADIDFETSPGSKLYWFSFLLVLASLAALSLVFPELLADILNKSDCDSSNAPGIFGILILSVFVASLMTYPMTRLLFSFLNTITGGVEKKAKKRIYQFSKKHPDWHLRLYRTPAGYRVLVMHKTFDPNTEETLDFFTALKSDPLYILMCQNQCCFRARVSPKPWRIGLGQHIKPRPGVWPVNSDRMQERIKWIEAYEKASHKYASCRFEEKIGSNIVSSKAEYVRSIHDKYCNASSHWPMA